MSAPHPSRKPWKEMALLLGWVEYEEISWFAKVWGGAPCPYKVLRHPKIDGEIRGRRRWQEAVKISLRREKAVGTSRKRVD